MGQLPWLVFFGIATSSHPMNGPALKQAGEEQLMHVSVCWFLTLRAPIEANSD